ncbi:MAG: ABC transporter substrate-binding protein [Proteobacteria bacterium]|nr:ABC transporter substrate-binding protein [Pseudomonadota bacterium]
MKPFSAPARLFAAAAFALTLGIAVAQAATPAETFIQENAQKGLTILKDTSLSRDAKQAQFQAFLESLIDIHRIALFTLGDAAKSAPPADVEAFTQAFRGYAAAVYQEQFAHYSGETLKVTGSMERAPDDFIVQTEVLEPDGSPSANDPEVDFRVSSAGGKLQVIDASVMGVWLSLQQRDQFTAFLSQHNNDVKALTADLSVRAANIRDSASSGRN